MVEAGILRNNQGGRTVSSRTFSADMNGLDESIQFVHQQLKSMDVGKKEITSAMLATEESLVALIAHARDTSAKDVAGSSAPTVTISISKWLGTVSIKLSAQGEMFDLTVDTPFGLQLALDDEDFDAEAAIRNTILRSFGDKLQYKHKGDVNTVRILVKKSERRQLYLTLGALALAIVLGLLFKLILPAGVQAGLDGYVLTPIKTMFLNALKMVVAPVVFFSIVSCVAQFGNFSEFGRMGGKTLGFYMTTTVIAIFVGAGIFALIHPGDPSLMTTIQGAATSATVSTEGASVSVLDTIVDIVPSNFIQPFLDSNMMQIIFIAVLCGVAVGAIGSYSEPLRDFFEACNTLFLKVTTIIVSIIPLAVFCSMTSLVMTMGAGTLVALLSLVGTFVAGLACMIAIYCLLLALVGRLNPLTFLRKYAPTMLTCFSLSSSSASMPFNIKACQDTLGVSPKVCSFSIPLGATVNMDGTCIYLAVASLFLARVYGVELSGADMFMMFFSILLLSVGAPGIPGSALVCLSVLLVQVGIPVEGVSLIMGIDPFFSMLRAMSNCTGDVVASLVVSKSEKLLDVEMYNR